MLQFLVTMQIALVIEALRTSRVITTIFLVGRQTRTIDFGRDEDLCSVKVNLVLNQVTLVKECLATSLEAAYSVSWLIRYFPSLHSTVLQVEDKQQSVQEETTFPTTARTQSISKPNSSLLLDQWQWHQTIMFNTVFHTFAWLLNTKPSLGERERTFIGSNKETTTIPWFSVDGIHIICLGSCNPVQSWHSRHNLDDRSLSFSFLCLVVRLLRIVKEAAIHILHWKETAYA